MRFAAALAQSIVPEGRMFALDQQTLISIAIQLINFCVLAAVLGFLLYKPVQRYMRARTDRIKGQMGEAQAKMLEAQKLKAEYEAKLNEITVERALTLEEAREECAKRSRHMIEEARHEAQSIRRRAEEGVLEERERLKRETSKHIIEISALMAEKLVKQSLNSDMHDKLFEEALSELEEKAWPH